MEDSSTAICHPVVQKGSDERGADMNGDSESESVTEATPVLLSRSPKCLPLPCLPKAIDVDEEDTSGCITALAPEAKSLVPPTLEAAPKGALRSTKSNPLPPLRETERFKSGWVASASSSAPVSLLSAKDFEGDWITEVGAFSVGVSHGVATYTQDEGKESFEGVLKLSAGRLTGSITSRTRRIITHDVGDLTLWFEEGKMYSMFVLTGSDMKEKVRCFTRPDLIGEWYSFEGVLRISDNEQSCGRILSFVQPTDYGVATAVLLPEIVQDTIVYIGYVMFGDTGIGTIVLRSQGETMLCIYTGQDGKDAIHICRRYERANIYVQLASLKEEDGKSLWMWVSDEDFVLPPLPRKLQDWVDTTDSEMVEKDKDKEKRKADGPVFQSVPAGFHNASVPMLLADQIAWVARCIGQCCEKLMYERFPDGSPNNNNDKPAQSPQEAIQEFYHDIEQLVRVDTMGKVSWDLPEEPSVLELEEAKSPTRTRTLNHVQDDEDYSPDIRGDSWRKDKAQPCYDHFRQPSLGYKKKAQRRGLIARAIRVVAATTALVGRRIAHTREVEHPTRPSLAGLMEISPPLWNDDAKLSLEVTRADSHAGGIAVSNMAWFYFDVQVAALIVHPKTGKILVQDTGYLRVPEHGDGRVRLGTKWNDILPSISVNLDDMSLDMAVEALMANELNLKATPTDRMYQVLYGTQPDNIMQFVVEFELRDADVSCDDDIVIPMHQSSIFIKKHLRWTEEDEWSHRVKSVISRAGSLMLENYIMVPWLPENLPDEIILNADTLHSVQTGQLRFFRKGKVGALVLGDDYVHLDIRAPNARLLSSRGFRPCMRLRPYETVRQCVARIVSALHIDEPLTLGREIYVQRHMGPSIRPSNIRRQTAEHWVTAYCDTQFGTEFAFPGKRMVDRVKISTNNPEYVSREDAMPSMRDRKNSAGGNVIDIPTDLPSLMKPYTRT